MKTYRSTREVLAEIQRGLASVRLAPGSIEPLEQVVETLYRGRHYFSIGIYLVIGDKLVRPCFRGPEPTSQALELGRGRVGTAAKTGVAGIVANVSAAPADSKLFTDAVSREVRSEAVQPIKLVTRVLGVIDVQSDQRFPHEDRVLLKKVSVMLAHFLTGRGKYLMRSEREAQQSPKGSANRVVRSAPQPDKNLGGSAGLRAVAGNQAAK